jgi:hypothetical protein
MARPVIGNYFEGKPCPKCGGTLRYVKGHVCVKCTHVRNVRKSDHATAQILTRVRAAHTRANIRSIDDLRKALDLYASTNGAIERSKHLNQLVHKKFATLLGETVTKPQPKQMTAGGRRRLNLCSQFKWI